MECLGETLGANATGLAQHVLQQFLLGKLSAWVAEGKKPIKLLCIFRTEEELFFFTWGKLFPCHSSGIFYQLPDTDIQPTHFFLLLTTAFLPRSFGWLLPNSPVRDIFHVVNSCRMVAGQCWLLHSTNRMLAASCTAKFNWGFCVWRVIGIC